MEIAHIAVDGTELRAAGTQIGAVYELRYELWPGLLTVEIVGGEQLTITLEGADFFDLGYSPLFNRCRSCATTCSTPPRPATTRCSGYPCHS